MAQSTPFVEVAAAVIIRPDDHFLLTSRPEGRPYAGYWEFPGGKIEAGESALQALDRELQEELGIQIKQAYPWITRVFTYAHATVRLHFYRVVDWYGEPFGRENQLLSWQTVDNLSVTPLLPANFPVMRGLALPSVYAITNASELGEEAMLHKLEHALQQGLKFLQIREKTLASDRFHWLASEIIRRAHTFEAKVVINSDILLSRELGADGVHLTSAQLMSLTSRPDVNWCGASCHNAEELVSGRAHRCGFCGVRARITNCKPPRINCVRLAKIFFLDTRLFFTCLCAGWLSSDGFGYCPATGRSWYRHAARCLDR